MPLGNPPNYDPQSEPTNDLGVNRYWWGLMQGMLGDAQDREVWDVSDQQWLDTSLAISALMAIPFETLGDNMQTATGTYTGDGNASQAIASLGFTPALVMVSDAKGTDGLFCIRFSTECFSWRGTATENNFGNTQIASLDADGFTVSDNQAGLNNHLNNNGDTYHYFAIGE